VEFYFNAKLVIVKVVLVLSNIPSKFKLAVIKILNPAYIDDKDYIYNPY